MYRIFIVMVGVAVGSLVTYTQPASAQTLASRSLIPADLESCAAHIRQIGKRELDNAIGFLECDYSEDVYLTDDEDYPRFVDFEFCAIVPYPRIHKNAPKEYTTVTYTTRDGTAKAGVDYEATTGTVQVPNHRIFDEGCFTVRVKADPESLHYSSKKYFFVNLSGDKVNKVMGQTVMRIYQNTFRYTPPEQPSAASAPLSFASAPLSFASAQEVYTLLPAGQKILDATLDGGTLSFRVQRRGGGIKRAGRGTRTVRLFTDPDETCWIASQRTSWVDGDLDTSFRVQPSNGAADDRYLTIRVSTTCESVDIELEDDVNGKVWGETVVAVDE